MAYANQFGYIRRKRNEPKEGTRLREMYDTITAKKVLLSPASTDKKAYDRFKNAITQLKTNYGLDVRALVPRQYGLPGAQLLTDQEIANVDSSKTN